MSGPILALAILVGLISFAAQIITAVGVLVIEHRLSAVQEDLAALRQRQPETGIPAATPTPAQEEPPPICLQCGSEATYSLEMGRRVAMCPKCHVPL